MLSIIFVILSDRNQLQGCNTLNEPYVNDAARYILEIENRYDLTLSFSYISSSLYIDTPKTRRRTANNGVLLTQDAGTSNAGE